MKCLSYTKKMVLEEIWFYNRRMNVSIQILGFLSYFDFFFSFSIIGGERFVVERWVSQENTVYLLALDLI